MDETSRKIASLTARIQALEDKAKADSIERNFLVGLIELTLKDLNVANIKFLPVDFNPTNPGQLVYYKDGVNTGIRVNFDGFVFQLDATAV